MYDAWFDCYPRDHRHGPDMVTMLELLPRYIYDGEELRVSSCSALPFKTVVEFSGEVIYDGRSPKLVQRIF